MSQINRHGRMIALLLGGMLAAVGNGAVMVDVDHPAKRRLVDLPPSANLLYLTKARKGGMQLTGYTTLEWMTTDKTFFLYSATRASLLGTVLVEKSEGKFDQYGLVPASYTEEHFHKGPSTTSFDHESNQIRFSESDETYWIAGGEQDRSSAIWQLIALARGARGKFKANSQWNFFVAGSRDAEMRSFQIGQVEVVPTAHGEFKAIHVTEASSSGKGNKVDIWLAPSLEWYPIRILFSEDNGDYIEQVLDHVDKTAK